MFSFEIFLLLLRSSHQICSSCSFSWHWQILLHQGDYFFPLYCAMDLNSKSVVFGKEKNISFWMPKNTHRLSILMVTKKKDDKRNTFIVLDSEKTDQWSHARGVGVSPTAGNASCRTAGSSWLTADVLNNKRGGLPRNPGRKKKRLMGKMDDPGFTNRTHTNYKSYKRRGDGCLQVMHKVYIFFKLVSPFVPQLCGIKVWPQ